MAWFRKVVAGLVKAEINDFIGEEGNIFFDVDTGELRLSDGITPGGIALSTGGGGGGYTLPTASTTTKGGIKVDGTTVTVADSVLSVVDGVYTTGSYANPSWLASLAYSKLTGAPTSLSAFTNDPGYLTSSTASTSYQPLDGDLTSIAGLAGASGILRKTGGNTWSLDTSTYLTSFTETDPVFSASAAAGITSTNITNWGSAYSWGNHALAGYALTSILATVATSGSYTDLINIPDPEAEMAYAKRTDFASDTTIYKGEAVPGTADSAAAWRIRRLTLAADDDVTEEWADGNSNYDNVWNNRAALSYS